MRTCLIGHTGFVGSALTRQTAFDHLFHSGNSAQLRDQGYDLIICAGAPAAKWQANREPEADRANLQRLMDHLRHVECQRFVLISTVDVFHQPREVDEESLVDPLAADAYGRHRFYLEEFVRERFARHTVVRLPGLFGQGLKKNFIYDLLHRNALHLTHCDSVFQFYHTARLWQDLQAIMQAGHPLVHIATEPVTAAEVAAVCFGESFGNRTDRPPARYDMWTRYGALFGRPGARYLQDRPEVLAELTEFVAKAQAGRIS